MLQSRIQKQIPERLSHYTTIEALRSILSDTEGKGVCLCNRTGGRVLFHE